MQGGFLPFITVSCSYGRPPSGLLVKELQPELKALSPPAAPWPDQSQPACAGATGRGRQGDSAFVNGGTVGGGVKNILGTVSAVCFPAPVIPFKHSQECGH